MPPRSKLWLLNDAAVARNILVEAGVTHAKPIGTASPDHLHSLRLTRIDYRWYR